MRICQAHKQAKGKQLALVCMPGQLQVAGFHRCLSHKGLVFEQDSECLFRGLFQSSNFIQACRSGVGYSGGGIVNAGKPDGIGELHAVFAQYVKSGPLVQQECLL